MLCMYIVVCKPVSRPISNTMLCVNRIRRFIPLVTIVDFRICLLPLIFCSSISCLSRLSLTSRSRSTSIFSSAVTNSTSQEKKTAPCRPQVI